MRSHRLVVIGGGFTGVAVVIHAIRVSTRPLDITIIEPASELGRGLAYGTSDPVHRINVPSDRMGMFVDDPTGPTRWFFDHGFLPDAGSADAQGQFYVPRHVFGRFVQAMLRETLAAAGNRIVFRHRVATADGLTPDGAKWRVRTHTGAAIEADQVALCFGHAAPAPPCPIDALARDHPKFIANPWTLGALDAIEHADSVLIAGTGLTMADVVASLRDRGHRGPTTAVSRRGLLPRPHGLFVNDLDLLEGEPAPRTARGLLRLVRRCLRRHGARQGWHPVVDSVRAQIPVLWTALPGAERRKVVRRLLPFWEVHRFRIAPQIEAALADARQKGDLTIVQANLLGITRNDGGFVVRLRCPREGTEEHHYDAIVLCTGPEKNLRADPLIGGLLTGGLVRLDAVGLGLAVDAQSRILDAAGKPSPSLLAFGPMTRGSFGEMTGAPDISRYIEGVAADLFGDKD